MAIFKIKQVNHVASRMAGSETFNEYFGCQIKTAHELFESIVTSSSHLVKEMLGDDPNYKEELKAFLTTLHYLKTEKYVLPEAERETEKAWLRRYTFHLALASGRFGYIGSFDGAVVVTFPRRSSERVIAHMKKFPVLMKAVTAYQNAPKTEHAYNTVFAAITAVVCKDQFHDITKKDKVPVRIGFISTLFKSSASMKVDTKWETYLTEKL